MKESEPWYIEALIRLFNWIEWKSLELKQRQNKITLNKDPVYPPVFLTVIISEFSTLMGGFGLYTLSVFCIGLIYSFFFREGGKNNWVFLSLYYTLIGAIILWIGFMISFPVLYLWVRRKYPHRIESIEQVISIESVQDVEEREIITELENLHTKDLGSGSPYVRRILELLVQLENIPGL